MNPHDENGFLGGQITEWMRQHRQRHDFLFTLAEDLNRECHAFLGGRSVTTTDSYQLTVAVLFARLLELYQAVLIAIYHGARAPARIQFRAFLEAYFHFAAIHKDPLYLEEYLDQFEYERKALVNRMRHTTDPLLESLRQPIDEVLLADIAAIDIPRISIERVAQRGGCHNIYLTAYVLLSRSVHSSASDLEAHLELDLKGKQIVGFHYGPTEGETTRTIGLAGITMAEVLRDVSIDFSEKRTERCQQFVDSFTSFLNARDGDT